MSDPGKKAFEQARQRFLSDGDFEEVALTNVNLARTKCASYISALTTIIPILPSMHQFGGGDGELTRWSIKDLIEMRRDARKWLTAHPSTTSNRRTSFIRPCGFRD